MKIKGFFFCFLYCALTYSQVKKATTNPQKIVNILDSYFKVDRESIHVQFNKQGYVTNETIGFKAYVLSMNNEAPNKRDNIFFIFLIFLNLQIDLN